MPSFAEFFVKATGRPPYPYQTRLATVPALPELLSIPTGLGKTAAVTLAWLWRRRHAAPDVQRSTPRLVYCLPMRTLVDQTATTTQTWLTSLKESCLDVDILMGGEEVSDWNH